MVVKIDYASVKNATVRGLMCQEQTNPIGACFTQNIFNGFKYQVNIIWLPKITKLFNSFSISSQKQIRAHYTNYVISKDYTDQVDDGLWNDFVFKNMYGMDLSAHIYDSWWLSWTDSFSTKKLQTNTFQRPWSRQENPFIIQRCSRLATLGLKIWMASRDSA